jgi:hypothetical protein
MRELLTFIRSVLKLLQAVKQGRRRELRLLETSTQIRHLRLAVCPLGPCSEVKSHLGSHLLTPVTRLYTQHTNRHPGVASSGTMGEVTDVRVNKTCN